MKDIIKKIRHFSIYKNMLLIYLTSIITVIILIIGASYGIFLNHTKKQTAYFLDQLMGQITYVFSTIISQVEDAQNTILSDTDFNRYINYKTSNKIIDYDLFFRLSEIQSYYPVIENISVINLYKNDSVSTRRSSTNDLTFFKEITFSEEEQMKLIYRTKDFENYSSSKSIGVISMITFLPDSQSAIITDIPLNTLNRSCSAVAESSKLNAFYFIDSNAQIISPENTAADEETSQNILSLLQTSEANSAFVAYKEQQAYFFSQPADLTYWFVGVQNISSIYHQYQQYSLYFIFLSLILAAIGSILFWKYTNRTFSPLIVLLEKYQHALPYDPTKKTNEYVYLQKIIDQMEHEKYIHEHYIQQEVIKTLLLQNSSSSSVPADMSSWYQDQFLHPFYYVLVFHISPEPDHKLSASDLELLHFSIKNVSQELFSSEADCFCTDIDSMHIAIVLALNVQVSINCTEKINRIRILFQQTFHADIKASLGNMVDVQGLSDSYNRALQYLKFNFYYDTNGFIDSNQYLEDHYLDKNVRLNHQIKQYVEDHYNDINLSINMVAEEMHLSSTYTGKLFKALNNVPFSTYLSDLRLEKSRLLLQSSNDTINTISEKIGFANSTYYTTLFKKKYGCTPTQYRSVHHSTATEQA